MEYTVGYLRFKLMPTQDSYCLTGYKYDINDNVIIPNEVNGLPVTRISRNTFAGCAKIKHVTIPATVFEIGERAFQQCINLKSVKIEGDVVEIYREAFRDCSRLRHFTANAIKLASTSTFRNCKNLCFLDCTFEKRICEGSFCYCESLESIRIGANAVVLNDAFEGCMKMRTVVFDGDATIDKKTETFMKKRHVYCKSWSTLADWAYDGVAVFIDHTFPMFGFQYR